MEVSILFLSQFGFCTKVNFIPGLLTQGNILYTSLLLPFQLACGLNLLMLALTFQLAPVLAMWLQFPLCNIPKHYMFLPLCSIGLVVQTSLYFFVRQETTKHFIDPGTLSAKTKRFTSTTTSEFRGTRFKRGEVLGLGEVVPLDTKCP